jgi:hypothetical protein
MLRKIIFINLIFASANILLACCFCSNSPVGTFEINKITLKKIIPYSQTIKGIAFSANLKDSLLNPNNFIVSSGFYSSAMAMSPCNCPEKRKLKYRIKAIKILTHFKLNSDIRENANVTEYFVSDVLKNNNRSNNILKTTIEDNLTLLQKWDYVNNNNFPEMNFYLTLSKYNLPAQFTFEVLLENGQKINSTTPIFQ